MAKWLNNGDKKIYTPKEKASYYCGQLKNAKKNKSNMNPAKAGYRMGYVKAFNEMCKIYNGKRKNSNNKRNAPVPDWYDSWMKEQKNTSKNNKSSEVKMTQKELEEMAKHLFD